MRLPEPILEQIVIYLDPCHDYIQAYGLYPRVLEAVKYVSKQFVMNAFGTEESSGPYVVLTTTPLQLQQIDNRIIAPKTINGFEFIPTPQLIAASTLTSVLDSRRISYPFPQLQLPQIWFGGVSFLTTLNLSGNQIKGLTQGLFDHCSDLLAPRRHVLLGRLFIHFAGCVQGFQAHIYHRPEFC